MASKKLNLGREEIAATLGGESGGFVPPVLSPQQLADVLGKSVKTIYEWMSQGHLDGAYVKRGKHCLFWRDRVIDILFNGKEWK